MKRITPGKIEKAVLEDFSTLNHNPRRPDRADYEHARALDEKEVVIEIMREFIPIFKKINRTNNSGAILQTLEPMAAKMLGTLLIGGSERGKIEVCKQILDRTMGKPIERQFSLHSDISKLSEAEVDNEITKLLNKLNPNVKEKLLSEYGFDGEADVVGVVAGEEPDL